MPAMLILVISELLLLKHLGDWVRASRVAGLTIHASVTIAMLLATRSTENMERRLT